MPLNLDFPLVSGGRISPYVEGTLSTGGLDVTSGGRIVSVIYTKTTSVQTGASNCVAEADVSAIGSLSTSSYYADLTQNVLDPLIMCGPLGSSIVKTAVGPKTISFTGAAKYAPALADTLGNPTLLYMQGNSYHKATNRSGTVGLTNGSIYRYTPGYGGRINRHGNPRLANNATGWGSIGSGVFNRIADASFTGGFAAEVTANAFNTGMSVKGGGRSIQANVGDLMAITVSFDVKYVSGDAENWYVSVWSTSLNETNAIQEKQVPLTANQLNGSVNRVSIAILLANEKREILELQVLRGTATPLMSGTLRISNLVVENDVIANPTYFDGDSAGAVWADPLFGIQGTAHASGSMSNAAFFLEEAASNLLSNPSFETNTTSWQPQPNITATRTQTYAYAGDYSIQLTKTDSRAINDTYDTSFNSGATTYTFSVYLRGVTSLKPKLYFMTPAGSIVATSANLVLTDQWTRYTLSYTTTSTGAWRVGIQLGAGGVGESIWIDAAQVEARAKPTSYVDGSLGDGYTWTSTVHASTSSRNQGTLATTVYGHVSSQCGAVSFWVKPFSIRRFTAYTILTMGATTLSLPEDFIRIRLAGTGVEQQVGVDYGNDRTTSGASGNGYLKEDQWNFIYCAWDAKNITIGSNNSKSSYSRSTYPIGILNNSPGILIPFNANTNSGIFGMQQITFYDQPLRNNDLARLYNQGVPPSGGFQYLNDTYPRTPRINLCLNPRAMNGTTGWNTAYGGNLTQIADGNLASAYAMRIQSTGPGQGAGPRIVAKPTIGYLVSCSARVVNGSTTWAIVPVGITKNNTLATTGLVYRVPALSSAWRRVSVMVIPPTGTEEFLFLFTTAIGNEQGTIDVTDVVVETSEQFPDGCVPDYFDGDSPGAEWVNPLTWLPATSHESPSISAAAPYAEALETNLVINPSFENDLTEIYVENAATVTRDTTAAYVGTAALKLVTTTSTADGVAIRSIGALNTTSARTFQGTVFTRTITGSATLVYYLRARYTDGTTQLATGITHTAAPMWLRRSVGTITTSATKTLDSLELVILNNYTATSKTVLIDAVQITENTLETTYLDGSLGDGYAWNGTPHASTSIRSSTLPLFPTGGKINATTGAIAGWINRQHTRQTEIVGIGYQGDGDWISAFISETGYLQLSIQSGTNAVETLSGGQATMITTAKNAWRFVYVDWSATQIRATTLYSASNVFATRTRVTAPTGYFRNGYDTLRIGGDYMNGPYGGNTIDGLLSNVQVFSRPLSQAEILDFAFASRPIDNPLSPAAFAGSAKMTYTVKQSLLTSETNMKTPSVVEHKALTPTDGLANLTADGLVLIGSFSLMDATGEFEAVTAREHMAQSDLVADGALSAGGGYLHNAASILLGAGITDVDAIATLDDEAFLLSEGTISAVAAVDINSLSEQTASGNASFDAGVIHDAIGAASGISACASEAICLRNTASILLADAAIGSDATCEYAADLILDSLAQADALAVVRHRAGSTLLGTGDHASNARVTHVATSAMAADTDIDADSIALVPDSAFIDALGQVIAAARVWHEAESGLIADGVSLAIGQKVLQSPATLTANGEVATNGVLTLAGELLDIGIGNLIAVPMVAETKLHAIPAVLKRLNAMPLVAQEAHNALLVRLPDVPSLQTDNDNPLLKSRRTEPSVVKLLST